MCTLVCRWRPGAVWPVEILALRDEFAHRSFDLPGAWWPAQPSVVGGRDQRGGGTWCASDVTSGRTAVVLNGGDERKAEPGAASRGVLPLRALQAGQDWPSLVELAPMASFNLVLAEPDRLTWWSFHGDKLETVELGAGLHLFTPRGRADSVADERLAHGRARWPGDGRAPAATPTDATESVWADWLPVVAEAEPSEDPLAMLVEVPKDGEIFETVFGQFILAVPGRLRLDYTVRPAKHDPWTTAWWPR
ncbi:MAG: hypothetical protein JWO63_2212 [Frankiales bacterium]|nr:hypothetical protein [Frankiales bacterium]